MGVSVERGRELWERAYAADLVYFCLRPDDVLTAFRLADGALDAMYEGLEAAVAADRPSVAAFLRGDAPARLMVRAYLAAFPSMLEQLPDWFT